MVQRREPGRLFRLAGFRLGGAEVPVGAAALVLDQRHLRVIQLEGLQYQTPDEQILQQRGDMQPRQFEHVALASPVGIADGQALDIHTRCP